MMTKILLLVLSLSPLGASTPSDTTEVRPALRVSGRVIDRAGNPVPKARLAAGTKLLAHTDANGRFAFDVPATDTLTVDAPPFAPRTIALDPSTLALGDIILLRAGSVVVDTTGVRGLRELVLVASQHRHDPGRAITRKASGSLTIFNGLEPGSYLLTARGAGALQQKSQPVQVDEGALQHVAVTIDRMPLRGYVYLGREPLANANVQIIGPHGAWQASVRTDAEGHYAGELWQVGHMQAAVTSPLLPTEYTTAHRVTEALERKAVEWDILIPHRKVLGRVLDEEGQPIPRMPLSVEMEDGEVRSRINMMSDARGAFEYTAARTGRYAVEVQPKEYLKPAPLRVEMRDDDADKRVEIRLERGTEVRVRVAREDGTPIAGAIVADGISEDRTRALARHRTSASGEAILRGRIGEEKTIYAIPPHGSFAVARFTLDDQARKNGIDVIVPDAKSALVIRTRDGQGAALGGIRFAMSYNGEVLPPAIINLIRALQHVEYRTTPAGEARIHGLPSGLYELWAYRTAAEGDRLAVSPERYEPSLQLAVAEGTYEADLTFGK